MSENFISRIQENDNIDEIFSYVLNNIYQNGPSDVTDFEILTYLRIYQKDAFELKLNKILYFIGLFYKENLEARSLEEVVFGQYRKHIRSNFDQYYTPVQSKILYNIQNKKCYSFSAPTSTGKSFVF